MLPITLEGKVAVITGSIQGIRFCVALVMASVVFSIAGCGASEKNMNVNLKPHKWISKTCYPFLIKLNEGILLMNSNHAFSTIPECFPYNVSKSVIDGLFRALAVQCSKDVWVINIAPRFIETEGGEKWFNSFQDPKKKRKESLEIHPTKKLVTVKEVGAFCAFLCSGYANFITGTTYQKMEAGRR